MDFRKVLVEVRETRETAVIIQAMTKVWTKAIAMPTETEE
jgi:hypothetical protein